MQAKFYAVGLGPGRKGLITYRAVEVLQTSDVVFVPDSGSAEQVAFDIVKEFVAEDKIVKKNMPMCRDLSVLDKQHDLVAEEAAVFLRKNKSVAFANLGDPTIYGSVMYIHKRIKAMGGQTEIIPGVPSFCAAAASLDSSLCERGEPLHIIPASYGNLDEALRLDGCKVLMKAGHSYQAALDQIKKLGREAQTVARASMQGEEIYDSLEKARNASGYFTLIFVR